LIKGLKDSDSSLVSNENFSEILQFSAAMSNTLPVELKVFLWPSLGFCCSKSILLTDNQSLFW